MNYFVWLDEQQQGPFDEETIQKMVSDGRITHGTLLSPEGGSGDWTLAKDLFPQETSLDAAALSDSPSAVKSIEEPTVNDSVKDDDNSNAYVELRLNSGSVLKVIAIQLYDEITLARLNAKKAEAAKMFQGVSTGFGAIGSIEWVAAASLVIGVAEAALSAGATSAGARLLEDAMREELKLRMEGLFVRVGKIKNIETPIPSLWRVPFKTTIQVEVQAFLGSKTEKRTANSAFVHCGDDFILMETDEARICSIRWSSVEYYAYMPNI